MDVAQVREVGEIVIDEKIVGPVIHLSAAQRVAWIVQPDSRWNQLLVRAGGLAHPHPDPTMSLDYRKGSDTRLRGYEVLAGDIVAYAVTVVAHAVIHAAYLIAFAATL